MTASFGSLYKTDNGSTYCTADPLTQKAIQEHFGDEVDTAGTNADVLARAMANELKAGSIRSDTSGISVCYEGFCGKRPVTCKGADMTEIPRSVTRLILLGGQHTSSPEGLTEDDITRIAEAIKSKWKKYEVETSNKVEPAPLPVQETQDTPASGAEDVKATKEAATTSPEKPSITSAPEPNSAKKRKPNNVKSKVKKKKKRTGTLSFVD